MPYVTPQDMEAQYGTKLLAQLTGDSSGEVIDEQKVQAAIADADALIDSFCRSQYQVPFASPPRLIQKLSREMALYFLKQESVMGVSEQEEREQNRRMELLRKIQQGVVRPDAESAEDTDAFYFSAQPRLFSR